MELGVKLLVPNSCTMEDGKQNTLVISIRPEGDHQRDKAITQRQGNACPGPIF